MAYTDDFKNQVIRDAIATSNRAAAKKHGIGETSIRNWLKERQLKTVITSHIKPKVGGFKPSGRYAYRYDVPRTGLLIGVLPDVQAKHGQNFTFLGYTGRYFAEKKPDVILCGGDFADMPSLSTYEKAGSMGYEGQRYRNDILAAHHAMKALMTPIQEEMKATGWKPRLIMLYGNHENRINRAIEETPKLDGVIGLPDLEYERWGWEVIPFLQPIVIGGVSFCHYFCSGIMGRPITTAKALLTKKFMSCFAFHQQGYEKAHAFRGDGVMLTAIISGSCYLHSEEYLNHQTNNHFRGFHMLHDVVDGTFEEIPITLDYIMRRYES